MSAKGKRAERQERQAIREAEESRANQSSEPSPAMAEMAAGIMAAHAAEDQARLEEKAASIGSRQAIFGSEAAPEGSRGPSQPAPMSASAELRAIIPAADLLKLSARHEAFAEFGPIISKAPPERAAKPLLPDLLAEFGPIIPGLGRKARMSAAGGRAYSRDAWAGALPLGPARFLGGGKASLAWLPDGAAILISGYYQILPAGKRSEPIFRYAIRYGSGKGAKASILSAPLCGPLAAEKAA